MWIAFLVGVRRDRKVKKLLFFPVTESFGNGRGRGRESLRYEGHIGLRFSACFPSAVGLPSVRRLPFRHPIDSVSHPTLFKLV